MLPTCCHNSLLGEDACLVWLHWERTFPTWHLVPSRLGPMSLSLSLLLRISFHCSKAQPWIDAESWEPFQRIAEPEAGPRDPDTAESAVLARTERWWGLTALLMHLSRAVRWEGQGGPRQGHGGDCQQSLALIWKLGARERGLLKKDSSVFLGNAKMAVPWPGGRTDPTRRWWVPGLPWWSRG